MNVVLLAVAFYGGGVSAVHASRHNIYCEKCSEKRQAQ